MAVPNGYLKRLRLAEKTQEVPEFPVIGFDFSEVDVKGEEWELQKPLEGMNIPVGFAYEFEGRLYGTHKSISHSKV